MANQEGRGGALSAGLRAPLLVLVFLFLVSVALVSAQGGGKPPFGSLEAYRCTESDPECTVPSWETVSGQEMLFRAVDWFDPDGGKLIDYRWSFGDGSTETGAGLVEVRHVFFNDEASTVARTVSLTVVDEDFEAFTILRVIQVRPAPEEAVPYVPGPGEQKEDGAVAPEVSVSLVDAPPFFAGAPVRFSVFNGYGGELSLLEEDVVLEREGLGGAWERARPLRPCPCGETCTDPQVSVPARASRVLLWDGKVGDVCAPVEPEPGVYRVRVAFAVPGSGERGEVFSPSFELVEPGKDIVVVPETPHTPSPPAAACAPSEFKTLREERKQATAGPPPFVNLHLVIDASGSMARYLPGLRDFADAASNLGPDTPNNVSYVVLGGALPYTGRIPSADELALWQEDIGSAECSPATQRTVCAPMVCAGSEEACQQAFSVGHAENAGEVCVGSCNLVEAANQEVFVLPPPPAFPSLASSLGYNPGPAFQLLYTFSLDLVDHSRIDLVVDRLERFKKEDAAFQQSLLPLSWKAFARLFLLLKGFGEDEPWGDALLFSFDSEVFFLDFPDKEELNAVFLIVDEEDDAGTYLRAAERAAERGIPIYTFQGAYGGREEPLRLQARGVCNSREECVRKLENETRRQLSHLSQKTGGRYFRFSSPEELRERLFEAYNDLAGYDAFATNQAPVRCGLVLRCQACSSGTQCAERWVEQQPPLFAPYCAACLQGVGCTLPCVEAGVQAAGGSLSYGPSSVEIWDSAACLRLEVR